MLEQADTLEVSINKFDELKNASKLSTEEFGRFVDINSEISKTADPNVIARLKDEQAKLTEKSGLSNEQLSEMVRLNGEILKAVPQSNTVLTDQGNVLLENTGVAKKYNEQQMEMIRLELEAQKAKAEASMEKNLVREKTLLAEQKQLKSDMNGVTAQEIAQRKVIAGLESDLATAKATNNAGEVNRINNLIAIEKQKHQIMKDEVSTASAAVLKKQEEIAKVQAQIGKLDEVKRKMVDIELRQVGINAKRGTEISAINTAISKLEKQKQTLRDQTPINQRNTQEYQEAAGAIQSQINNLQGAKSKVEEIIGRAAAMNDALGKNITKVVTVQTRGDTSSTWMRNKVDPDYNRHTGGTFPRKLHVGGNAAQFFANAPSHNEVDVRLLRNEMVLTEAQQANLFRLIDAGMTNKSGAPSANNGANELARIVDAISSRPINVGVIVEGREIAKATAKYNQEELDKLTKQQTRLGGNV
jgi:hypothetical protein